MKNPPNDMGELWEKAKDAPKFLPGDHAYLQYFNTGDFEIDHAMVEIVSEQGPFHWKVIVIGDRNGLVQDQIFEVDGPVPRVITYNKVPIQLLVPKWELEVAHVM